MSRGAEQAGYRVGVDIGGTFTDLVAVAPDGTVQTKKVPTTSDDYGRAVVEAMRTLTSDAAPGPSDVSEIVHGTTVCTNAILEGKGALTGLITTFGFRDALEIGRMRYPRLYDLGWTKPRPLVPRRRRLEVVGRLDYAGSIIEPLDEDSVREAIQRLLADGVESLAVSLLHSYANPRHEERVRELIRAVAPEISVSLSSELLPEIGEYERTSTTVINAYLQLVAGGYLKGLAESLSRVGVDAPIWVMQSNGGRMSALAASERPIHIVESGPAAGVIAAMQLARRLSVPDVIALDMGGTTAKASIIEAGELHRASEYEVGAGLNIGNRLNTGAGYRLRVPAIDIAEVGAGGGSIVTIDGGGALRVGPESAGADPGPICYDHGGSEPTLTDANLILGYLNPVALLGGQLPIDLVRARRVFAERVAQPLGLDLLDAAFGVHRIAVANMVRAVKAISTERGRDPRRFTFVAYGGNGPLHAVSAAADLGVHLVVVPPWPGLFSAFGLLSADPSQHASRSLLLLTDGLKPDVLEGAYRDLEGLVAEGLEREGYARDEIQLIRSADLRYAGQSFEMRLSIPTPVSEAVVCGLDERFGTEHERAYGHRADDDPVEVVHIRVEGRVPSVAGSDLSGATLKRSARSGDLGACRMAYFGPGRGLLETRALGRQDITRKPMAGPLIVEEYDATTVVPPGSTVLRDEANNLVIRVTVAP